MDLLVRLTAGAHRLDVPAFEPVAWPVVRGSNGPAPGFGTVAATG
jgi:hypothetical protein